MVGIERRTARFETGDVTSDPLMLCYINRMFISYTLSHFLSDFPYGIGLKKVYKWTKCIIRQPMCTKFCIVHANSPNGSTIGSTVCGLSCSPTQTNHDYNSFFTICIPKIKRYHTLPIALEILV